MKRTRTKEQVEQDERKGKQKYSEIDIESEMPTSTVLALSPPTTFFQKLGALAEHRMDR
jgi:hypothetical protein